MALPPTLIVPSAFSSTGLSFLPGLAGTSFIGATLIARVCCSVAFAFGCSAGVVSLALSVGDGGMSAWPALLVGIGSGACAGFFSPPQAARMTRTAAEKS